MSAAASIGLVSSLAAVTALTATAADGAVQALSARSLDVVGGPIAVGSTAVVVSVDANHSLYLDGVDPVSDTVLWRHPYAGSAVTNGVALTPASAGAVVADLVPAGSTVEPTVMLAGINAATGAVEWEQPGPFIVADNPAACVSNQDFCIPTYGANASSELTIIDASTGQTRLVVSGPDRALAPSLYQSSASTPTLEQLSATGAIAWTKSVASIFGPGYDPSYGWNIDAVGGLNVGTVGVLSSGTSFDFGNYKTVGFSVATGATQWSIGGSYQCLGSLAFLTSQVSCQYTGTVHYSKTATSPPSLRGLTLKLVGFDPATGSPLWSYPVSDVSALAYGNGLRFVDATHVVVQSVSGKTVVLDTSTGTAAPLKAHQRLWCETIPTYTVTVAKGTPGGGKRTGTTQYSPCTQDDAPASGPPPSTPSTVGVTVNGVFVWPSAHGLNAEVVGTPVATT